MSQMLALVKKECREDIISSRGGLFYLAGAIVLSAFALLLVGNTELSLLDNAQALYLMSGLVLAIALLSAVIRGGDGFAGERDRGTLETLLAAPLKSNNMATAKLTGILFSWLVLFLLAVPYLWAVGSSGQNLGPAIAALFAAGTLLTSIYGGLMLALSARARSFKGVLSVGVAVALFSAVPLVLGPSLRQSAVGHLFDWLNPFALCTNMIDSIVIDSQGLEQNWSALATLIVYLALTFMIMNRTTRKVTL